jgi:hypothetical protein
MEPHKRCEGDGKEETAVSAWYRPLIVRPVALVTKSPGFSVFQSERTHKIHYLEALYRKGTDSISYFQYFKNLNDVPQCKDDVPYPSLDLCVL